MARRRHGKATECWGKVCFVLHKFVDYQQEEEKFAHLAREL